MRKLQDFFKRGEQHEEAESTEDIEETRPDSKAFEGAMPRPPGYSRKINHESRMKSYLYSLPPPPGMGPPRHLGRQNDSQQLDSEERTQSVIPVEMILLPSSQRSLFKMNRKVPRKVRKPSKNLKSKQKMVPSNKDLKSPVPLEFPRNASVIFHPTSADQKMKMRKVVEELNHLEEMKPLQSPDHEVGVRESNRTDKVSIVELLAPSPQAIKLSRHNERKAAALLEEEQHHKHPRRRVRKKVRKKIKKRGNECSCVLTSTNTDGFEEIRRRANERDSLAIFGSARTW